MHAAGIHALLGSTNTGKTHRAVVRMLEHESGMLGFPLRLLAREVFDRVRRQVGDDAVALVTGEEKIVPPTARYFVCTVEAMPLSRSVEFLAVDEIQLAAHEQRGHLFTERLLDARGSKETWFMGSDTMREVLTELVPTAQVSTFARLSKLSYAGADNLPRVPPRSALVAFSLAEVYALAERVRARRGGAAVVAGALSPRTRNAQVALFQEGAVDYLIATDAIGMGLNLDVRHVAFASLRKFDGRDVRALDDAETAQIAGRAGRHLHDGTFGSLRPAQLAESTIFAVEHHRLPKVRRIFWRSTDLDFSSAAALVDSLQTPPPAMRLQPAPLADDLRALQALVGKDAKLAGLRGSALHLLWDVCKIPDYRKLLFEHHVSFLADLYEELHTHAGRVRNDWLAARVERLDRVEGEVDELTARIAETRLYTYLTNQGFDSDRWVDDAESWRHRTTAIEDRLSDALHERLVERFVDETKKRPLHASRTAPRTKPRSQDLEPARAATGHPFAALASLRSTLHEANGTVQLTAAPSPLEELLRQPPEHLQLGEQGEVRVGRRTIGRARRGSELAAPRVAVDLELGPQERRQAQRHVEAVLQARTLQMLPETWARLDDLSMQGTRFALRRGLGITRSAGLAPPGAQQPGELHTGQRWLRHPARRQQATNDWVRRLLSAAFGALPPLPSDRVLMVRERLPLEFWEAAGFARVGLLAVPLDLAELMLEAIVHDDHENAARAAIDAGVARGEVADFLADLRDDVEADQPALH